MRKLNTLEEIKERKDGGYELSFDNGKGRIYWLTDSILRFRFAFQKKLPAEASYVLALTAWKDRFDSFLGEERTRIEPLQPPLKSRKSNVTLKRGGTSVMLNRDPFHISIKVDGQTVHSDIPGRAYLEDTSGRVKHYQGMGDEDRFYGLGEKSGPLNKACRRFAMSNTDTFAYDPEYSDPLYKHIPFFVRLSPERGITTGYFYNNAHRSDFDMGCERSAYWPRYSYFSADGGELDYFIILGTQIKDILRDYARLTGLPAMPPRYSLGYMGSTMSYTELPRDCDKAVLDFVEKCRENSIPVSGFHLSSGYSKKKDGNRYVFHWNRSKIGSPQEFNAKLEEKGVFLSPNTKPGLLLKHHLYQDFKKAGAYVRDRSGEKPAVSAFWGGPASFVDFSNPDARALWKKHLVSAYLSKGISAIWNDNCEFEIDDDTAVCRNDGNPVSFLSIRPVLTNLMGKTVYDAIIEHFGDRRPFVLSRAGFAGIQRYAQTWSGDNLTSWKSLKYNIATMLGMGLSGVPFQGVDIGGFAGNSPEPELLARWVQNGAFYPRFSIHSCNEDGVVTEPWMYPEMVPIVREAIRLRYRLMPYLYSLAFHAWITGDPLMRPLVYEFQDDPDIQDEGENFLLGPFIMVVSATEKSMRQKNVRLPRGAKWTDWHTGVTYNGGKTVRIPTPLNRPTLLVRSGAVIPMNSDNLAPDGSPLDDILEIAVNPQSEGEFTLYDDDGLSRGHERGEFQETQIRLRKVSGKYRLTVESQGNYRSERRIRVKPLIKKSVQAPQKT